MEMNVKKVKTWHQFAKHIRPKGCNLLGKINDFPESVLVAGCQRSGTTVLSRVITGCEDFASYKITNDNELDAALILSGYEESQDNRRHCFQTTYLNECYREYLTLGGSHKIIWVIRNPLSVVYSLLYNWTREPLNNLFEGCALDLLTDTERKKYDLFYGLSVSRIKKAALSYVAKSKQIIELAERLDPSRILVVDYQDLVCSKEKALPLIFDFIDYPYNEKYKELIHSQSINKAAKLNKKESDYIERHCMPMYTVTKKLAVKV